MNKAPFAFSLESCYMLVRALTASASKTRTAEQYASGLSGVEYWL